MPGRHVTDERMRSIRAADRTALVGAVESRLALRMPVHTLPVRAGPTGLASPPRRGTHATTDRTHRRQEHTMTRPSQLPVYLSLDEAAEVMSLSTRTIRRRISDGTIPAYGCGRRDGPHPPGRAPGRATAHPFRPAVTSLPARQRSSGDHRHGLCATAAEAVPRGNPSTS